MLIQKDGAKNTAMNRLSYEEKLARARNPAAQQLLSFIVEKESNLCASLDVSTVAEVLSIAEKIGDQVCMIKTHVDTYTDFTLDAMQYLHELGEKKHFSVFEDRKFADIGNTVKMQYKKGVHHIVEWSDITNAHLVPGPGIVAGLKEVGMPKGRGLLLLAEMSSAGSLATGEYTRTAYQWAREYPEFVIGFIGKGHPDAPADLLMCTPGIHLESSGDQLGQQYQTPCDAIVAGTDIIIVGRGIYTKSNPQETAELYRKTAWEAYRQAMSR